VVGGRAVPCLSPAGQRRVFNPARTLGGPGPVSPWTRAAPSMMFAAPRAERGACQAVRARALNWQPGAAAHRARPVAGRRDPVSPTPSAGENTRPVRGGTRGRSARGLSLPIALLFNGPLWSAVAETGQFFPVFRPAGRLEADGGPTGHTDISPPLPTNVPVIPQTWLAIPGMPSPAAGSRPGRIWGCRALAGFRRHQELPHDRGPPMMFGGNLSRIHARKGGVATDAQPAATGGVGRWQWPPGKGPGFRCPGRQRPRDGQPPAESRTERRGKQAGCIIGDCGGSGKEHGMTGDSRRARPLIRAGA